MSDEKFKDMIPYEYEAKILRWIDGDTVKLSIDLGFHTRRIETVRIMNYDAPETRLYKGVTEEEKGLGIKAKEFADALVPVDSRVIVHTYYDKQGKYGRFLADVLYLDKLTGGFKDYAETMKAEGFVKGE